MKLALAGGHLTPALAMIDWLKENHPETKLVFFGRTHSRNDQVGVEFQEISQRGIEFFPVNSPKFANTKIWLWPRKIFQLITETLRVENLLKQQKIDAVLGFGGYLAVPVILAAWRLKLPRLIHEQTRSVGLANRWLGKFATIVTLAFAESQKYFNNTRTVVVGNPLRQQLFSPNLLPPTWYKNPQNLPLLVVTGGSQGSRTINQVIDELLPALASQWCVVHQRGPQNLQPSWQSLPNYFQIEWLTEAELFWLWKQPNSIGISRSGANTVTEIALTGIPSILVPLPFSYQQEQLLNAKWLAETGGAIILEQTALTVESLSQAIAKLFQNRTSYHKTLLSLKIPLTATQLLWQLIQKYV